jgi:hypothetical protein
MARFGRRFPIRAHTEPLGPQTAQETSTLAMDFEITAGSTVTSHNTASLAVDFEIGANQNSALLSVITTMSAASTLTLQQSAALAMDFEISATASEQFNSGAVLPVAFSIGTASNVTQSSTMAMVFGVVATPTSGNLTLICSIAAASGTDAMGNAYPQGLAIGIPLGPQSLFDVSGNATIQGNLEVDGAITNAALAATLLTYANAITTLQAQHATDAANINTLQNQVATLQSQMTAVQNTLLILPVSFLNGLAKLPHQSDNNTTLSGVLAWANNLTDNLQANGFMH